MLLILCVYSAICVFWGVGEWSCWLGIVSLIDGRLIVLFMMVFCVFVIVVVLLILYSFSCAVCCDLVLR